MDIFEELFGNVLSEDEIREMIFLRNNGKLRVSYKGDSKLQPNPEQLRVFADIMHDVYKLAALDDSITVIPPDITPDTAFRINLEVPIGKDFFGESKDILARILPKTSSFGFEIKDEELMADFAGDVETISFGFVVPDVYTYPYEEAH